MSAPPRAFGRRTEELYALLLLALFAAVALWRWDLVEQAARATASGLAEGGRRRWVLLFEIALFSGILLFTWLSIPKTVRPARDLAVLALGALAGWAAEAWGTRLNLWRYYTGEAPPLWIVPVWPLGAALIERWAERARAWGGPARPWWYWTLCAACLAVVLWFCGSNLSRPAVWLAPAAAAAAFAAAARPEEDFWILAVGVGLVFFADLWGVSNNCWRYWLQDRPFGMWRGIAFGMAFDAAVVLATLKSARLFTDFLWRPRSAGAILGGS